MINLQIPPHPKYDYQCALCKHWLAREKVKRVLTPQGLGPKVSDLIQQGQNLEAVTVAVIAPCTRFPAWHMAAENHWCGEWESRVVS